MDNLSQLIRNRAYIRINALRNYKQVSNMDR